MPCLSLLPTDRPSEQRFCETRLWDALARHEFIWRRNSRDSRLEFVERDARCPHGGVWGPRRPRAASGPSAAGRAAERSRAPSGESSVWRDGGRGRGTAVNGMEPAPNRRAGAPPAPRGPRGVRRAILWKSENLNAAQHNHLAYLPIPVSGAHESHDITTKHGNPP